MDGGAQVNLIQRDAYIQSASMLGWKSSQTKSSRFEQICIYISGLTQLTATEAISNIRGKESHAATCPVPYCHVCGSTVGKQGETESLSASAQSILVHIRDNCMKGKMYTQVEDKYYTPLQIPGDYFPNMDHIDLIEAQLTKEGMIAYESIAEASIAAFQEMIPLDEEKYISITLISRYKPIFSCEGKRELLTSVMR